jgi:hypothetical protein
MNLITHPVWSKVAAGLIVAALTATTGMALSTRETVLSHSLRLDVAEKQLEQLGKTLPKISEDVAVLRDRSDREEARK